MISWKISPNKPRIEKNISHEKTMATNRKKNKSWKNYGHESKKKSWKKYGHEAKKK